MSVWDPGVTPLFYPEERILAIVGSAGRVGGMVGHLLAFEPIHKDECTFLAFTDRYIT